MPIAYPPRLDAWYLTGPTASGKTDVAAALAARIDAEVLSLDSMAIYRGMNIGTAKPASRRVNPGGPPQVHLINLVEPSDDFNIADYVAAAHRALDGILARGKAALFVGGTPLYLTALLRGLFVGPEPDLALRRELHDMAQRLGGQVLHERLAKIDPAAAARLHSNDVRRMIRAIEVFERTGRPISDHQKQFDTGRPAADCRVFVLDWPRNELYARIDQRVDQMFAAGWVEEVRGLQAGPYRLGRTAGQAVGYREIVAHLAGKTDLATTIELVKTRTRQFAKRQLTWFRSLSECRWMPVSAGETPSTIAERIALTVCGNTV